MMYKNRKVIVDLAALQSNIALIKNTLAPGRKILAYVKAQAYGHGMSEAFISAMHQVDGYAVACLEEAKQLRLVTDQKIVLNGAHLCQKTFDQARDLKVDVIVHQAQFESSQIASWSSLWLKVNTGMNRMGLTSAQARQILSEYPEKPTVLMTHLADSLPYSAGNEKQIDQLKQLKHDFPHVELSFANSSRLLSGRDVGDWVRPGLLLYGISAFSEKVPLAELMQPISRFCARVIAHQHLNEGDTVGYDRTYVALKAERIAIVAAGYADGYPRISKAALFVADHARFYSVVGKVSMDTLSICESEGHLPEIGSWVTLWGDHVRLEAVANACERSPYELLVHVSDRVNREYIGG